MAKLDFYGTRVRRLYRSVRFGDSTDAVVCYQAQPTHWREAPGNPSVPPADYAFRSDIRYEERVRHSVRVDLWLAVVQFSWLGPWRRWNRAERGGGDARM